MAQDDYRLPYSGRQVEELLDKINALTGMTTEEGISGTSDNTRVINAVTLAAIVNRAIENYFQTHVMAELSTLPRFNVSVVEELPDTPVNNTVYVIPRGDGDGKLYDQKLYSDGFYYSLGTREITETGNTINIGKPESGYYTLQQAIAQVPKDKRKPGLSITYPTSPSNWEHYQFMGDNVRDWADDTLWRIYQYNIRKLTKEEFDTLNPKSGEMWYFVTDNLGAINAIYAGDTLFAEADDSGDLGFAYTFPKEYVEAQISNEISERFAEVNRRLDHTATRDDLEANGGVQYFDKRDAFPAIGRANMLYLDKASGLVYSWDDDTLTYAATGTDLDDVELIDSNF